MGHVDVRTTGSGNIGTTNVARSVGKGAAALTLLLDLGKGLVWMLLSRLVLALVFFGGDAAALDHTTFFGTALTVVFLGCICGHVFSPYLHFHGGKGIAVGFGAATGQLASGCSRSSSCSSSPRGSSRSAPSPPRHRCPCGAWPSASPWRPSCRSSSRP